MPSEAVEHGEVFTRRWVVELILDLVGYTSDKDLAHLKIVEPACGEGSFLGVIAARVSASCRSQGVSITAAVEAVQALDLLDHNVARSREVVEEVLLADGWEEQQAHLVATSWVAAGDYLLQEDDQHRADFVVGNPPYIRLEDVPDQRM